MHIEKQGLDFFNGSYSDLIEFVSVYAHYPEADFLLGKIYKLEGEYSVALNYMKDAYEYSVNLDVSMEKYDLLYEFGRLVTEVKPDIITMENVPSIQSFKLKNVLSKKARPFLEAIESDDPLDFISSTDHFYNQDLKSLKNKMS